MPSVSPAPHAEQSLLARPLVAMVWLATRVPWLTVLLAVGLTVWSVWITVHQLRFRTSRADLLNPASDYNQRWLRYTEEFGAQEDVVVVVEGDDAARVTAGLDYMAAAVESRPDAFAAVLPRLDFSRVRARGLYYVPPADLAAIEGFLDKANPVLQNDWAQLSPANMSRWLGAGQAAGMGDLQQRKAALAEMQTQIGRAVDSLRAAMDPETPRYVSPWPEFGVDPAAVERLGAEHLVTDDGRLGMIVLKLRHSDNEQLMRDAKAIALLRQLIAEASPQFPGVRIGLTGLPVIEHDEMESSQNSSIIATILSFVSVLFVLVLAFGGVWHSVLAMLVMLMATAWTCGWATAHYGHLNLLSISFGSILFGLGIDYGVSFLAGYLPLRSAGESMEKSLRHVAATFGPGITTGALTTSVGFGMVGLTSFPGVAQLGVIACVGILLCWLAELTVLPALLVISDRRGSAACAPPPLRLTSWVEALQGSPRRTVICMVAATLLVAIGARHVWYDYNLLNLQAEGLESVELEHKLMQRTRQSACFAISVCDDPAELLARKDRFLDLPTVERVEEIAQLFPGDVEQKRPIIARIHERLAHLPAQPPQIPVAAQAELEQVFGRAQSLLSLSPDAAPLCERLADLRQVLRRLRPEEYFERMAAYQQRMAAEVLGRLSLLQSVSNPQPPRASDLPPGLVSRFCGRTGKLAQKIYARVNLWDMAGMERFVREIRSVDPDATGNPMQIYEAARHMKRSYEQAALYTLLGILPLMLLDFRRISDVLLACIPVAMGLVLMFGIMGALDVPLNPANMIVLPFLLGTGVDQGIHFVHDWRRQGSRYRTASPFAALAVIINSLTTVVGFATLLIASHRGLQSLGRVLTIGMSTCMLSALLLPNLLVLLTRKSSESEELAETDAADAATDDVPATVQWEVGDELPMPAAAASRLGHSEAAHHYAA